MSASHAVSSAALENPVFGAGLSASEGAISEATSAAIKERSGLAVAMAESFSGFIGIVAELDAGVVWTTRFSMAISNAVMTMATDNNTATSI